MKKAIKILVLAPIAVIAAMCAYEVIFELFFKHEEEDFGAYDESYRGYTTGNDYCDKFEDEE